LGSSLQLREYFAEMTLLPREKCGPPIRRPERYGAHVWFPEGFSVQAVMDKCKAARNANRTAPLA